MSPTPNGSCLSGLGHDRAVQPVLGLSIFAGEFVVQPRALCLRLGSLMAPAPEPMGFRVCLVAHMKPPPGPRVQETLVWFPESPPWPVSACAREHPRLGPMETPDFGVAGGPGRADAAQGPRECHAGYRTRDHRLTSSLL